MPPQREGFAKMRLIARKKKCFGYFTFQMIGDITGACGAIFVMWYACVHYHNN